ncbi:hypothetical protein Tco_0757422 [Tanacetum coccineum]
MTQGQWNHQQYEQQLQQRFQHLQQNPPQYYQNPQSSQNPINPTPVDTPKKGRKKRAAKVASSSDTQDKKFQRWMSQEEELLAKCFVAVSEDPNVGRDQKLVCFWGKSYFLGVLFSEAAWDRTVGGVGGVQAWRVEVGGGLGTRRETGR